MTPPLRRSPRNAARGFNVNAPVFPSPYPQPDPSLGVDPATDLPYRRWTCRSTEPNPRFDLLNEGETIAVDGEFVQYKFIGDETFERYWGRVTAVGENLQTLYDIYANYDHIAGAQKMYDPPKYGVSPEDLLVENGAEHGETVEQKLKALVRGHPVVFHDRKGDMKANVFEKDMFTAANGVTIIHDTQDIFRYVHNKGFGPSLAHCASQILGKTMREEIDRQSGIQEHNPLEDAVTTMELFLWDREAKRQAEEEKEIEKKQKEEEEKEKKRKEDEEKENNEKDKEDEKQNDKKRKQSVQGPGTPPKQQKKPVQDESSPPRQQKKLVGKRKYKPFDLSK